jgi:hypothetical protein
MMWIALVLFIVAIGAAFYASGSRNSTPKLAAWAAAVLGVVFLVASMISFVPTRNVGIVVAYGKPTGRTTGAGMQLTAPWQGIADWDATRQSYNHLGDACTDPSQRDGLWVTIAGQRNMCVRVQVNWETTDKVRATQNWGTYRERGDLTRFEVFTDYQVIPGINSALLDTFRTFDPLALVDVKTGEATAPDLGDTYTPELKTNIAKYLRGDIVVEGITWGPVGYDKTTTNLIAARAQKTLESRNLAIDKANATTREAIANSSGVPAAVQQCLDLVKSLGKGEPGLCMGGNVQLTKPVG